MHEQHEPGPRVLTALLTARPEKQEELSNTLQVLLQGLRGQAGCLDPLVARELGGEARFILHCLWDSRAALSDYLASDDYRVLRGASSILTGPDGFRLAITHPESPPGPP